MRNQSTNHAATITTFGGFVLPESNTNSNGDITMPLNWPEVSKAIDNLAELKVVQLVLWITWGNGQPDALMPLTVDDFIEVTGLCKRSVANGIKKALEHGYINRQSCDDESNLCYYGIQLASLEEQNVPDDMDEPMQDFPECPYPADDEMQILPEEKFASVDESAFEAFLDENANFAPSKELELPTHNYYYEDISRIQGANNSDENTLSCGRLQMLSREDNATLCCRVESLSNALGDVEHTAQNIGQARHILASYLVSGGEFEAFLLLMYDARDIARKKTNMRRPNRMPYFFACLRRACAESKDRIAA